MLSISRVFRLTTNVLIYSIQVLNDFIATQCHLNLNPEY